MKFERNFLELDSMNFQSFDALLCHIYSASIIILFNKRLNLQLVLVITIGDEREFSLDTITTWSSQTGLTISGKFEHRPCVPSGLLSAFYAIRNRVTFFLVLLLFHVLIPCNGNKNYHKTVSNYSIISAASSRAYFNVIFNTFCVVLN